MKGTYIIFGALFAILVFSNTTFSQQTTVFKLNQFDAKELAKVSADEKSFFQLNEEVFYNPALKRDAILELQKRNGNTDRLVILDREVYMPGTVSIRAYREGSPENIFVATYRDGSLNGIYYDEITKPIYLGFDRGEEKNFISLKNELVEGKLTCTVDHSKELFTPIHNHSGSNFKTSEGLTNVASPLVASEDDSVTIDLLIIYTQAAENWASTSSFGDINGVIAQAMNISQATLNSSQVGVRLRLVHAYKTNYNELNDGVDSEVRLDRLIEDPANPSGNPSLSGYMDDVHTKRNQFGADVVAFIGDIDDTGGIAPLLSTSGGNPANAFSVNRVQQVADTGTLIHEIGHNMGSMHSRTQSEAAASGGGGLFHYSVGYQNDTQKYHTVMSYEDNGQQEALIFSSPNLTYLGTPAGLSSSTVPADNARSLREVKRTISNYRNTVVSPPTASLLADVITIEMNREDNLTIPFQIFNNGESVLVWDIDFGFFGNGFKAKKQAGETREIASFDRIIKSPYNFSGSLFTKNKSAVAEEVLYSTSFESSEGFTTGIHEGLAEWRAISNDEFSISSLNPSSGSQHLRISGDGSGNAKFIGAPFFGYQLFGSYEITVNFFISNLSEIYDIYLFDGKNGKESAGIIIANQSIFAAVLDEQNEVNFQGTSATVTANRYHELKIILDPENEVVRYIFNGSTIAENEYVGGFSPGELQILNRSEENGSRIDVDDIEIKKISSPYSWLTVNETTGYTLEGGSSSRSLGFSTVGVDAGTYRTKMLVRTNDPQNPQFEVPITLTVANVVSNEQEETPFKLSLNQNYPNPFNPTTTISYSLETSDNIQLDVFNIQGQKVATLYEGKQQQGAHDVTFDASNLSSGVYIYRLQTSLQTITRQMVLIK